MRVLLQRVKSASVTVAGNNVASIGQGLLLLVGIREDDTQDILDWMVNKVSGLRIFEDSEGKFNLSLEDVKGEVLVVSQFTLYGDARKGKRPSFSHAARPELAEPMCKKFAQKLRDSGFKVGEGIFGAMMDVELINDGPVTLMIEK